MPRTLSFCNNSNTSKQELHQRRSTLIISIHLPTSVSPLTSDIYTLRSKVSTTPNHPRSLLHLDLTLHIDYTIVGHTPRRWVFSRLLLHHWYDPTLTSTQEITFESVHLPLPIFSQLTFIEWPTNQPPVSAPNLAKGKPSSSWTSWTAWRISRM